MENDEPVLFGSHVEEIEHEDGSFTIKRWGRHELFDDESDHSELYHQVKRRIRELGCEAPSFLERLKRAEAELVPIQDEALAFLEEHAIERDDDGAVDKVWDTDDNWRTGRW